MARPRFSFLKAHGLGNDFLLHLQRPSEPLLTPEEVRLLCDRRLGVGADGVIHLLPGPSSRQARMVLHNQDGSPAEISGNGLRCAVAALSCWWGSGCAADTWQILTGAGLREGRTLPPGADTGPGSSALLVAVSMGRPAYHEAVLSPEGAALLPGPAGHRRLRLQLGDRELVGLPVALGNPHFVIPGPLPSDAELQRLGPLVEHHEAFPGRINGIWLEAVALDRLRLKIWERGAGVTPACGSGACAAAVAACWLGLCPVGSSIEVEMPGGRVQVALPSAAVRSSGSPARSRWSPAGSGCWPASTSTQRR